jgi:alkylation response protein AidB-like acyl-CoA dehydrogenase
MNRINARPAAVQLRHLDAGPGAAEVRDRGAEAEVTCPRSCAARSAGARAIPNRARAPTSSAADPREDKGDHWIVNGQKIWTSYANKADWIFCLVRTDPTSQEARRHFSFVLFDMETPGVTTKPIVLISGNSPFCETFFDDVRVEKENLIGELNRGWDVAKYLLQHERTMIGAMGQAAGVRPLGQIAKNTVGMDGDKLSDTMLRTDIARMDVDMMAFKLAMERTVDQIKRGQVNPAAASMLKYYGTELNKRQYELIMSAGGAEALEWESERSKKGDDARTWLRTKANSIEGGTSEVQLNIIAKRILNLPGA